MKPETFSNGRSLPLLLVDSGRASRADGEVTSAAARRAGHWAARQRLPRVYQRQS